jgi:hypothetical protein
MVEKFSANNTFALRMDTGYILGISASDTGSGERFL